MKRSSSTKVLTTHVGSLPRPDGSDRAAGEDDATLCEMVKGVVERQRAIGLDVINEGEYTKGGDWLSYVDDRFDGFKARPPAGGTPLIMQGKDREEFADLSMLKNELNGHWAGGVVTGILTRHDVRNDDVAHRPQGG